MVINARFVKPLDAELIRQVAEQTSVLLTIEENALAGGFGSKVSELLEREELKSVRLVRMGVPDTFIKHGAREVLLDKLGLSPEGISEKIKAAFPVEGKVASFGS